ncbi:MAG: tRNA preQ1(34) S-adenosylmethionine ribosyltransferase-isomerase QueA [Gammaproteobacteria bacterium]|nr:tRNA preQ1(34) S-adenosylmethionine ribosyltransferase-isomerase QueA [Gammaproteobacteria bacterium]MBU1442229.1 tRNA preQ1(34) S-adenosylmethionine ribosyltransferase-isomerase QueA [Gammaproteobacteria bacterium]MBU2287990.1 tRNA preQ1(34) S-adenosylmethionine ribosyltransferase-isomerase QueA [Gammaproteobacteria bacterium]MBU2409255.1 tRNA preQ1(34) S-adenosylmethionine ribosyltransferase-isomerase QueA [Gammaproteobacteria bacterium]
MPDLQLSDFDFDLPPELIAQHPTQERSGSRLLDGTGPRAIGRTFRDLPSLLSPGDLLVFNDTRVVKARLFGEKPTGGRLELLIERVVSDNDVLAHMKVSKKPPVGAVLSMVGGFEATLLGRWPDDEGSLFRLRFDSPAGEDPYALMSRFGHVPLPPYITHADSIEDEERYQTVFARVPGAVAAPTAALHFDEALLRELEHRGVRLANVTLHVGAGTFQPVKSEQIDKHTMHAERYDIPASTVQAIHDAKARNGRVVAVGTTTVRTLESWAKSGQTQGDTSIFIRPGFAFEHVDLLITNFHLPKSTLMMLVSAFSGHAHVMSLYEEAVRERYRFFSYGDAMLLQRRC